MDRDAGVPPPISSARDIDVERILMTDSIVVITCTILLNQLTKKLPAFSAIILGTFITGISWLIPGVPSFDVGSGRDDCSAGHRRNRSPGRVYYEYVSRLAPEGQQGTYMGFAFVPLGIGSLVGGWFGGKIAELLWRSDESAALDMVRDRGRGPRDHSFVVDLRPDRKARKRHRRRKSGLIDQAAQRFQCLTASE